MLLLKTHFLNVLVVCLLYYIVCAEGNTDSSALDGQELIANGHRAPIEDYPWHVGIYRRLGGDNNYTLDCGGSLISTKHVVTAAHCFWDDRLRRMKSKDLYQIALGKFHLDWLIEDSGNKRMELDEIIVQRQFRGRRGNFQYDIAIVRLKADVKLSPSINVVSVDWTNQFETVQLVNGNKGTFLGWGLTHDGKRSDKLQSVQLPYLNGDDCADKLDTDLQHLVSGDKFCAGYTDRNISACPGDSGGGLVFYEKTIQKYFLRGVLSINFKPGRLQYHGSCYAQQVTGFTSLSDPLTLQWIKQNTNIVSVLPLPGYQLHSKAGKYYKYHKNRLTWNKAKQYCQRQGQDVKLAVPTTKEQYDALQQINHKENKDSRMWLGLSDLKKEGEFRTTTGQSVSTIPYVRWNEYEPNNGGWLVGVNKENCVQFGGPGNVGTLNDVSCSIEMEFICEYTP